MVYCMIQNSTKVALNTCFFGDCRIVLRALADNGVKVQTCVTSPPYFGLRDYGVAGQLGAEKTIPEFIANLVEVFSLVWDVLADDGVLWLNLGDSMLPNKSEAMVPHRVAMALMGAGWICRQTIVWAKPNPMPESVRDRCTKSHEYVFMLTKSPKYYYDHNAIKTPAKNPKDDLRRMAQQAAKNKSIPVGMVNGLRPTSDKQHGRSRRHAGFNDRWDAMSKEERQSLGANRRSVWTVATQPYKGNHFATFPEALIEPMILAATSASGHCPECGKGWTRITEQSTKFCSGYGAAGRTADEVNAGGEWAGKQHGDNLKLGPVIATTTIGWQPSCDHAHTPVPGVVLDPFFGSGTTGQVALRHRRKYIGIELNASYEELQTKRCAIV